MQCDQEMCNKAVENYPHALEFVPECCKTQKMRDKVVHRCFFCIWSYSWSIYTQEMGGTVVSEGFFLVVYWSDKYKTQRMCDEAIDDCLIALKLVPDWFVTSKMIEKSVIVLYADENIL